TAVNLDASVTAAGSLFINETDAVTLSDVDTANGAINIVAADAITATNVESVTDNDANDITLSGTAIEVGTLNARSAGDISLTATTGALARTHNNSDLDADDLPLSASTDIGGSNSLNTTVAEIVSASAGTGIAIGESNGLLITSMSSTGGSIDIDTNGATDV